jgi:hypothetical protein
MSRTSKPHAKRRPSPKRGGQPGNANALKHGLYAARFRLPVGAISQPGVQPGLAIPETRVSWTSQAHITDLSAEIALLQTALKDYLQASDRTPSTDFDAARERLLTISVTVAQIGALARLQTRNLRLLSLSGDLQEWLDAVLQPENEPKD